MYETTLHEGYGQRTLNMCLRIPAADKKCPPKPDSSLRLESSCSLTYRLCVGRSDFAQARAQRSLRFWSSILRPLKYRHRPRIPDIGLPPSMVALSKVELSVLLPSNDMRLVMMQPYVDLNLQSEPFVWNDAERDRQFESGVHPFCETKS